MFDLDKTIVVINVYERFFYFSIQKRFLTFFIFFQRFLFKKTLNSQCENNSNLIHYIYVQKLKNQTAAHKIIADFEFRCT